MEHIKDCIAALREAAPEIDIAENELMRRHTTFAIGGPADLFVQPKTRRELTAALAVLRERNIPFLSLIHISGEDDIERMREQYDLRRRYLLGELRSMGLECFEPQGAFYMFPSIESTGLSSDEFCERLLHEQEVAVIPGSAFGESGEGHVRISYSYSMNHLREACSRIRKFLQTLQAEK